MREPDERHAPRDDRRSADPRRREPRGRAGREGRTGGDPARGHADHERQDRAGHDPGGHDHGDHGYLDGYGDTGGRTAPGRHPGYGNYPPPRRVSARRTPLPPLHPVDRDAPTDRRRPADDGAPHDPTATRAYTAPHGRGPDRTNENRADEYRLDGGTRHDPTDGGEDPTDGTGAAERAHGGTHASGPRAPRKLTVTRVAAFRSRELTNKGIQTFRRAATADGADKSGLTALTYATMANFAADAAMAVALANTLFFSAATGEDKTKVALYLLITIAPFAVIAPLIGPLLDRLQHGRRVALATSFVLRAALFLILIFNFDSWVLYPAALGAMVLSKSFSVLKSAVTPRVLPPEIDLVRVNSRLTVFGLVGGTIVVGGVAGAAAWAFGSAGALWVSFAIAVAGAYLSMRIPSWVEVTEGEVPATLGYHGDGSELRYAHTDDRHNDNGHNDEGAQRVGTSADGEAAPEARTRRQPLGRAVVTGLWGNGTIRVLTGFLTLFIAFVAKAHTDHEPLMQAAMLGLVGAGAGIGNFLGNATGARLALGRPALIVVRCTLAALVAAVLVAATDNLLAAAGAALVAACASALAKVSLDASLQNDLPEESIASGFGRSETVLQLSWVFGGALGVLLPTKLWIGFTVVSVFLALGLAQTVLTYRGGSLLPGFGGDRPDRAEQEPAHADRASEPDRHSTNGR